MRRVAEYANRYVSSSDSVPSGSGDDVVSILLDTNAVERGNQLLSDDER